MSRAVAALAALLAVGSLRAAAEEPVRGSANAPVSPAVAASDAGERPEEIVVVGTWPLPIEGTAERVEQGLASPRAAAGDSARLLRDVPGVALNGAGGISSLPAIRGLSDDRVRVQVDGVDLATACPNHMNSPLSYISPRKVDSAVVIAGITPVSVGGNSLGGTIQVASAPPEFAATAGSVLAIGRAGGFYRSNGEGTGYDFGAAIASRRVALSYAESSTRSDNYRAAKAFRPGGPAAPLRGWLDADEVGSSAYRGATNRDVELAIGGEDQLLRLAFARQRVGFEGFPNQRMDLTSNRNDVVSLRYAGRFDWGELDARAFAQSTRHEMDMGADRFFYGFGMPMSAKSTNRGAQAHVRVDLAEGHLLRAGAEYVAYRLDDWWSPVGASGSMCCQPFRNVHDGEQDRAGGYAEWEASWSPDWTTLLGVRGDVVTSDAGRVQGYNDMMPFWSADAAAFNARDRHRQDVHWDVAALLRWRPDRRFNLDGGFARKTRSPNLYERYAWSTNSMAALMNNFVGDGNGYVGKVDLRPEVAHTISATASLHDASETRWAAKVTAYFTRVTDFIDARRCDFGQCAAPNLTATRAFVFLQYANDPAQLYGADLDAYWKLGALDPLGTFMLSGAFGFVRGRNRETSDDLYHVMPLHGRLSLEQERGAWSSRIDLRAVGEKRHVSQVRNELRTSRHALLDLRASWRHESFRVDLALENVLDRAHDLPLGGAYVGQGLTMSDSTTPWGIAVPGPGRSVSVSVSIELRGGGALPAPLSGRHRSAR